MWLPTLSPGTTTRGPRAGAITAWWWPSIPASPRTRRSSKQMAHAFEIKREITVEATPEQVWEAITVGPKIDSWFMGRSEIEPREGGLAKTDFGDFAMESTVTAWEPLKRLAYRGAEGPDGSLHAFEY